MSVSKDQDYPTMSKNLHRASKNFWHELGLNVDPAEISQYASTLPLYKTVVGREVENDFLVKNKYGKNVDEPRGKISMETARRILQEQALEEDEVILRMFENGEWPEEVYDTPVEIVDPKELSGQRNIQALQEGYVLLEDFPDGFDFGEYDFLVVKTGGDYIKASYEGDESLFRDLEDMR